MSESLKSYNPTEKGRELIALLFPLSHSEREKNIINYWKQYPQEKTALLDGFHFLIQEIIEARNINSLDDTINLPQGFINEVVKQMLADKNYFSYDNGDHFFQSVFKFEPTIFGNKEEIQEALKKCSKLTKEHTNKVSNLPEEFDERVEKKFKKICKKTEVAYDNVSKILRSLRNSQKIIDDFKNVNKDISLVEVKLAKETFLESKKIFTNQGKIIAEGMEYVYDVNQRYPDRILVKKAYIKYLAKLLGSREARNLPENYVLRMAEGAFDFETPDFEPTERQLQHGKTKYSLEKEYKEELMKDVLRLEARYRKRKLTVLLKKSVSKAKIIKELQEILKIDPEDIKTHLFLAKLLAEYATSFNDHVKRGVFRDQALQHCQAAFSKIDDYLDLQLINKMTERDLIRAGFVKTISAIRIPLIRKK